MSRRRPPRPRRRPGVGALAGEGQGEPMPIQKVALASSIGATIEWYDFFIYGTAAGLVFNQLFFPTVDPLAGTLAAYATFAVGFFARPIGGVVFGHYGDRIGRKAMLVLTLLIMGVVDLPRSACCPTYDADRRLGADPAGAAADRPGLRRSAASGAARC